MNYLDQCKNIALLLFDICPIEKEEKFGLFLNPHVFLENFIIMNRNHEIVNILEDNKERDAYIQYWKQRIRNAKDFGYLFGMVRKPFRLTFLRETKKYLPPHIFAKYLHEAWITSENPNMDINVPLKTIIKWFKHCDKSFLMTPSDYEYYKNIPEEIIVYRGVSSGRKKLGLSWTEKQETAKWFQNRFPDGETSLLKAKIKKKDILAYFNSRGEDEIVVDIFAIKDKITQID